MRALLLDGPFPADYRKMLRSTKVFKNEFKSVSKGKRDQGDFSKA